MICIFSQIMLLSQINYKMNITKLISYIQSSRDQSLGMILWPRVYLPVHSEIPKLLGVHSRSPMVVVAV